MRNQWTKFSQLFVSGILPSTCVLCGAEGHGTQDICLPCQQTLPRSLQNCVRCGIPLPTSSLEALCGQCLQHPPPFERVLSPFRYESPMDHLVQQLKYSGRLEMARLLGHLMAQWLAPRLDALPDVIIPVPLHPRRLRERGFNQAQEMARPIARQLGLPIDTKTCRRTRFTTPQFGLSAKERAKNVKNAFQIEGAAARHVALVDDVMTTGQTVRELAKVLRKAGAEEIEVWVCARA